MAPEPVEENDALGHVIAATSIAISDALRNSVVEGLLTRGDLPGMEPIIGSAFVSGLSLGARVATADIVAGRRLIAWLDRHIERDEDNETADGDVAIWLQALR